MSVTNAGNPRLKGAIVGPRSGDETAVYRLYNETDELLYIGMSRNPMSRWEGHRNDKSWWVDVTSYEITWYPSRKVARSVEVSAIKTEAPRYNIADTAEFLAAGRQAAVADQPGDEEEVQLVADVVDSLEALEDPTERARRAGRLLAEWPAQGARLRRIRQEAVIAMRAQEISYRKIARTLGISLARVQQIEAGERGRKAKEPPAGE